MKIDLPSVKDLEQGIKNNNLQERNTDNSNNKTYFHRINERTNGQNELSVLVKRIQANGCANRLSKTGEFENVDKRYKIKRLFENRNLEMLKKMELATVSDEFLEIDRIKSQPLFQPIRCTKSATTEGSTNSTRVPFASEPILPSHDAIWEMDESPAGDDESVYQTPSLLPTDELYTVTPIHIGDRAKSDSALLDRVRSREVAGRDDKRCGSTLNTSRQLDNASGQWSDIEVPLGATSRHPSESLSDDLRYIEHIVDSLSEDCLHEPEVNEAMHRVELCCGIMPSDYQYSEQLENDDILYQGNTVDEYDFDDIARDWDYYIPGVEWTPRRIKTVTKLRPRRASHHVQSRRSSALDARKASLDSSAILSSNCHPNNDQDDDDDGQLTTITTTEIDYRLDPDEYRFSLPTKDDCLKAVTRSQERLFDQSPVKDQKKAIKLEKQISSLHHKYNDFQVSIDIEDSLVTVRSPQKYGKTPSTTSGLWSAGIWKSATGRVRKILRQFMDLVATPPPTEDDLAIARASRAAVSVDEQSSIMDSSKEVPFIDNDGFTDSGYLEDYDIPSLHSGEDCTMQNKSKVDPTNADSVSCNNAASSICPVHFVCEPSDGKSSLCIRCMRERGTTSSESSLLAVGEHAPLKLSPLNARNASDLRTWHKENTRNNNNAVRALSPEISKTIECMTPTANQDYTLDMDIPYIDQILKGSTSDMGVLFTTPSVADKYCLNHNESKDNLRKQLFNDEIEEIDLGKLAEKCSQLSSPHKHKHLYCITFDTSCACNNENEESSSLDKTLVEEDNTSLMWEEM